MSKRILYFDGSNGISGDMALAALLDLLTSCRDCGPGEESGGSAGRNREKDSFSGRADPAAGLEEAETPDFFREGMELLEEGLREMKAAEKAAAAVQGGRGHSTGGTGHCHSRGKSGAEEKRRHGPAGSGGSGEHGHVHGRQFTMIRNMIRRSGLSPEVRACAEAVYFQIARAEAAAHGVPVEEVHFHEVGRDEAIRNITGAALCAAALGFAGEASGGGREAAAREKGEISVFCSPLHEGTGSVRCSHGDLDLPVPAVRALLEGSGIRLIREEISREMVTPSGLGILRGLGAVCRDGFPPGSRIVARGLGFGKRDAARNRPLQVFLLESEEPEEKGTEEK